VGQEKTVRSVGERKYQLLRRKDRNEGKECSVVASSGAGSPDEVDDGLTESWSNDPVSPRRLTAEGVLAVAAKGMGVAVRAHCVDSERVPAVVTFALKQR
jgi:hypothetical protein